MRIIKFILLIFSITILQNGIGQVTELDKKLAMQYYGSAEYDKAVMYLVKIYEAEPTPANYSYYFKCLLELDRLKEAEKLSKKQIKARPEDLELGIDLAKVYNRGDKPEKAIDLYEKAINSINKNTNYGRINNLSTAFQKEGLLDYSLRVYQAGNKYAGSPSMYNRNIALIYGIQGKTELMIQTLLDMVHQNPGYQTQVQSALNNSIDFSSEDNKVELLKTELLRRTQKHPNKSIYNEMLAWLFTQKGDYHSAFIQIKALDKKENGGGRRLLALAQTSVNNEEFDVAIKSYDYVIGLGEFKPNYRKAKMLRLNTLKKKITLYGNASKEELESLRDNYIESINQIGKNAFSLTIIRDLANLYAFHLHDVESGKQLLEEALTFGGVKSIVLAEVKIELADILVVIGDIWDASLYYSQVEKAFKHEPIGHMAKFKNAKVFYYTGDFDWSQAQLDVLKASTSKLIANDAMELSMLITDNYNMDTTQVTMRRFARADLLIFQNKFKEAQLIYDSINNEFGYHTLNDEMLMRRSEMEIKQGNYEKAIDYLEQIVTTYGDDLLCDNALFTLGDIYQNKLKNNEKAYEYYKTIIFDHPGSLFTVEARKRFRALSKGTHTLNFIDGEEGIEINKIEKNEP